MHFQEINNPTPDFFSFLPIDWQSELLPQWNALSQSARVYGLFPDDQSEGLSTIGIVFGSDLPKLTPYEMELYALLKASYGYIGYVYTMPHFRGRGHASKWFDNLKAHFPKQNFWLTIEEPELAEFYKKNGFELFSGTWQGDNGGEICLIYNQNT